MCPRSNTFTDKLRRVPHIFTEEAQASPALVEKNVEVAD
jgi:hypothetical protein